MTLVWQIDELERVLKYPKLEKFIKQKESKLPVERIGRLTLTVADLPEIKASQDPDDNYILATAIAGQANLIVTGDKKDLLVLNTHKGPAELYAFSLLVLVWIVFGAWFSNTTWPEHLLIYIRCLLSTCNRSFWS